jgi:antitoxin component of MazEF toxin-antitoxin module
VSTSITIEVPDNWRAVMDRALRGNLETALDVQRPAYVDDARRLLADFEASPASIELRPIEADGSIEHSATVLHLELSTLAADSVARLEERPDDEDALRTLSACTDILSRIGRVRHELREQLRKATRERLRAERDRARALDDAQRREADADHMGAAIAEIEADIANYEAEGVVVPPDRRARLDEFKALVRERNAEAAELERRGTDG